MAKDPAFLFYSSDFLSGVQELTMEERGQYITLLCLQHQKGHLSEKLISLAAASATADVMAKFRQDSAGLWYNERLDVEIEKRSVHSKKQSERALEGWKKRKKDAAAYTTASAAVMPLENENENINEDELLGKGSAEGKGETPSGSSQRFLVPEMKAVFLQHKPKYLFRDQTDFQPLREIAETVGKAENADPYQPAGLEKILQTWDALCSFIASDPFYGTLSLPSISKHLAGVSEKMRASLESPKKAKDVHKMSVAENNFHAAEEAKAILKARRAAAAS